MALSRYAVVRVDSKRVTRGLRSQRSAWHAGQGSRLLTACAVLAAVVALFVAKGPLAMSLSPVARVFGTLVSLLVLRRLQHF